MFSLPSTHLFFPPDSARVRSATWPRLFLKCKRVEPGGSRSAVLQVSLATVYVVILTQQFHHRGVILLDIHLYQEARSRRLST
ncbi:hypothetical protein A6R68_16113, partial [Neotoma lepida]